MPKLKAGWGWQDWNSELGLVWIDTQGLQRAARKYRPAILSQEIVEVLEVKIQSASGIKTAPKLSMRRLVFPRPTPSGRIFGRYPVEFGFWLERTS